MHKSPRNCLCNYVKAFLHRPTPHSHTHARLAHTHTHTYAAHARREKWIAVETFHTHRKAKRKTHLFAAKLPDLGPLFWLYRLRDAPLKRSSSARHWYFTLFCIFRWLSNRISSARTSQTKIFWRCESKGIARYISQFPWPVTLVFFAYRVFRQRPFLHQRINFASATFSGRRNKRAKKKLCFGGFAIFIQYFYRFAWHCNCP